jgi:ABC-type glycerol-3-phosphate transport system substrate-binding protein
LGYRNTFQGSYGSACLETIQFPVEDIAAGNSGYAISNIWEGSGVSVNGEYKSYTDLSWDFIKFIISKEGQEVAGETGLNIPVLKQLYSAESNGGETPAWKKVESLGSMSHDAWVAGGELRQDTYNIFKAEKRNALRSVTRTFFANLQRANYNEGSLTKLIEETVRSYNLQNPTAQIR